MPEVNVIEQAYFMSLDAMLCLKWILTVCFLQRCIFIYKTYMTFCIIPLLSDYYLLVGDRKFTPLSLF